MLQNTFKVTKNAHKTLGYKFVDKYKALHIGFDMLTEKLQTSKGVIARGSKALRV